MTDTTEEKLRRELVAAFSAMRDMKADGLGVSKVQSAHDRIALADHSRTRPTFEGVEAEVRDET